MFNPLISLTAFTLRALFPVDLLELFEQARLKPLHLFREDDINQTHLLRSHSELTTTD